MWSSVAAGSYALGSSMLDISVEVSCVRGSSYSENAADSMLNELGGSAQPQVRIHLDRLPREGGLVFFKYEISGDRDHRRIVTGECQIRDVDREPKLGSQRLETFPQERVRADPAGKQQGPDVMVSRCGPGLLDEHVDGCFLERGSDVGFLLRAQRPAEVADEVEHRGLEPGV